MAKTPVSGMAPYAAPADYLLAVDVRHSGDLARDDGTQATPAELLTDPRLAFALARASGMVEAAVMVSGRYTVADLQALAGNSLALLKHITCGLTVQVMRQVRAMNEESDLPIYKDAVALLAALHEGKNIFAFSETVEAGLPATRQLQPDWYFRRLPTLTSNWTRSFGLRANRRGPGAGGGGFDRF